MLRWLIDLFHAVMDLVGDVFAFVADSIAILSIISVILSLIWRRYIRITKSGKSYGELAVESIKKNKKDPPWPYGETGGGKADSEQEPRFIKRYVPPDLAEYESADNDKSATFRYTYTPIDKRTGREVRKLLPYLEDNQTVVVLGEPGGGKSWLMRDTYWVLAKRWEIPLKQYKWPIKWIRKAYLDQLFPIYVPLRDWSKKAEVDLERFIQVYLKLSPDEGAALFNESIKRKCLLLLDGLDEIGQIKDRETFLQRLRVFIQDHPGQVQVVLTSRKVSFSKHFQTFTQKQSFLEMPTLVILPFSRWQIDHYLEKRFGKESPIFVGLSRELDDSRSLLRLATTPLLLGLMASNYESQWKDGRTNDIRLPRRRTALYREFTRQLIDGWAVQRGVEFKIRKDVVCETLRYLAFHLHQEEDVSIPSDLVAESKIVALARQGLFANKISKKLQEEMPVDEAIKWIAEHVGFLEYDPYREDFYFGHRTFQEYFAACYVAAEQEQAKRKEIIDDLLEKVQTNPGHWQEVIVMLAGSLESKQERAGLIRALMGLQPSSFDHVILGLRAYHEAFETNDLADLIQKSLLNNISKTLKSVASTDSPLKAYELIYVAEFIAESAMWREFVEDIWPGDTEDSLIRRIEALGAFDDPKAAEYLAEAAYMSHESTQVRTAARKALISLADLSVEPLFKLLRGVETSAELAEQILIVLASIRHAKISVQVIEWLAEKDKQGAVPSDLLEAASRAVAAQDTKEVKSYLSHHIVSGNKSMCQWAIRTWAEIGKTTKFDPENLGLATGELLKLLNRRTGYFPAHGEHDLEFIADEAARALAMLGNPAVTLLGERIIDVKETEIEERESAAFALGFVREAEHELAIGFLIEALNDPENAVLSTARAALKQIGCVTRPYLEKALESTKNTRHKKQIKLTLDDLNCYDQLQEGGSK